MRGLFKAAMDGDVDTVLSALAEEPDPVVRQRGGNQALIYATWKGRDELVRTLCEWGTDVNYQTPIGSKTALMFAARWGRAEIIRHLLAAGARVDLRDDEGDEAVDYARRGESAVAVTLLSDYQEEGELP